MEKYNERKTEGAHDRVLARTISKYLEKKFTRTSLPLDIDNKIQKLNEVLDTSKELETFYFYNIQKIKIACPYQWTGKIQTIKQIANDQFKRMVHSQQAIRCDWNNDQDPTGTCTYEDFCDNITKKDLENASNRAALTERSAN